MKTTKQQQLISLAQKIGFDQAIMRLGGVGSESADLFKGREADDDKTKDGGRSLDDCAHSPDKAEDILLGMIDRWKEAAADWRAHAEIYEKQKKWWHIDSCHTAANAYDMCASTLERSLSESRRGSVASVPANV